MIDIPVWALGALVAMFFAFGVFIGYAIATYEDLRQMERDRREMESEMESEP